MHEKGLVRNAIAVDGVWCSRVRGARLVFSLVALLAVLLPGVESSAATLDVVGGRLVGAFGVEVDGRAYDVSFRDGMCEGLFGSCNGPGDFTFSEEGAAAASRALIDEVLIDGMLGDFDSNPGLTLGCEGPVCAIVTPYSLGAPRPGGSGNTGTTPLAMALEIDSRMSLGSLGGPEPPPITPEVDVGLRLVAFAATNASGLCAGGNGVGVLCLPTPIRLEDDVDTETLPDAVFAVWTLVPEPGSAPMFLAGLAWLAARRSERIRRRPEPTLSARRQSPSLVI